MLSGKKLTDLMGDPHFSLRSSRKAGKCRECGGVQPQKARRHIEIFRGCVLGLKHRRLGAFRPYSRSLVRNAGWYVFISMITGIWPGFCYLDNRKTAGIDEKACQLLK
jgi:hypothetical protein